MLRSGLVDNRIKSHELHSITQDKSTWQSLCEQANKTSLHRSFSGHSTDAARSPLPRRQISINIRRRRPSCDKAAARRYCRSTGQTDGRTETWTVTRCWLPEARAASVNYGKTSRPRCGCWHVHSSGGDCGWVVEQWHHGTGGRQRLDAL